MNISPETRSFPPVIGEDPKILILGSIPGIPSLKKQQYYGNPRNHFWSLMSAVLNSTAPDGYEQRKIWLKSHQIALWDSLHSCNREGSLDAAIKNARPNEISNLVNTHPSIHCVACNGKASYDYFLRYQVIAPQIRVLLLPSSSPIPRPGLVSAQDKLSAWLQLRDYL